MIYFAKRSIYFQAILKCLEPRLLFRIELQELLFFNSGTLGHSFQATVSKRNFNLIGYDLSEDLLKSYLTISNSLVTITGILDGDIISFLFSLLHSLIIYRHLKVVIFMY